MASDKEYVLKNQILTKDQVYELYIFQKNLIDNGFPDGETTEEKLEGIFGALSLAFGIISLAGTVYTGLASAAFGLMSILSSNSKKIISSYLKNGKESLSDLYIEMDKNDIEKYKIDIAFYEFTDQEFRIVMDTTTPIPVD